MSDETITMICPRCGHKDARPIRDWNLSLRPERFDMGSGLTCVTEVLGYRCVACDTTSDAADWHRAKESAAIRAAGFVTPRMMREATVTA